jgi:signal transduction histidine kinase
VTTDSKPGKREDSGTEKSYRSALRRYLTRGGEANLRRAYDIGRRAVEEGRGLMEVASFHHQAVSPLVVQTAEKNRRQRLFRASAEFLLESLSPYEMAYRGFHDAIRALRHLNETQEEEIKRIALAVHDEAGQSLAVVHIALAELSRVLPEAQRSHIQQIEDLLLQAEAQLRRLSHELRPAILDDLGWVAAIRFLAKGVSQRTGMTVRVEAAFSGRLRGAAETALYRVVQEALMNATKHAKATQIKIQVRRAGKVVCCSIQDDGVGFDISKVRTDPNRGLGLVAMQERLNAVGGSFSVQSAPATGTRIEVRAPLE